MYLFIDQEVIIMTHEELVKEAFKAMNKAYDPDANYQVGAGG